MNRADALGEYDDIVFFQFDIAVDKMEVIYFFDPEDVDEALVELDRLHAGVESGDRG